MTGDEVRMEVGEKDVADLQTEFFSVIQIMVNVALRVDDDGSRVGLVAEQIRGMGKTTKIILLQNHCSSCSLPSGGIPPPCGIWEICYLPSCGRIYDRIVSAVFLDQLFSALRRACLWATAWLPHGTVHLRSGHGDGLGILPGVAIAGARQRRPGHALGRKLRRVGCCFFRMRAVRSDCGPYGRRRFRRVRRPGCRPGRGEALGLFAETYDYSVNSRGCFSG